MLKKKYEDVLGNIIYVEYDDNTQLVTIYNSDYSQNIIFKHRNFTNNINSLLNNFKNIIYDISNNIIYDYQLNIINNDVDKNEFKYNKNIKYFSIDGKILYNNNLKVVHIPENVVSLVDKILDIHYDDNILIIGNDYCKNLYNFNRLEYILKDYKDIKLSNIVGIDGIYKLETLDGKFLSYNVHTNKYTNSYDEMEYIDISHKQHYTIDELFIIAKCDDRKEILDVHFNILIDFNSNEKYSWILDDDDKHYIKIGYCRFKIDDLKEECKRLQNLKTIYYENVNHI